jgi:large conductance mechanosensitive channel
MPEAEKIKEKAARAAKAAGGFLAEFREFINRGSVVDMAVGVIVGGAFGKIVSSLVADVLMPPLGVVMGGVKFTDLKVKIGGTEEAPVTINYGNFLQATFDFLIIAFCVFLLVKGINALRRPQEEPPKPKEPSGEEKLLAEIRDLLKGQGRVNV